MTRNRLLAGLLLTATLGLATAAGVLGAELADRHTSQVEVSAPGTLTPAQAAPAALPAEGGPDDLPADPAGGCGALRALSADSPLEDWAAAAALAGQSSDPALSAAAGELSIRLRSVAEQRTEAGWTAAYSAYLDVQEECLRVDQ